MSKQQPIPARFINLDVELKSSLNLTPIAKYLDESVCILSCDFFDKEFLICMEAVDYELGSDVGHYTEYMLRLLEHLPKQYEELMNSCSSCVFDYGFEGGIEDKPISVDLTPVQIARIAALNVTLRITVYPCHLEENIIEK